MIRFKCPFCDELMEVSDRKKGEFVECVRCGEMAEVKFAALPKPKPKRASKDEIFGEDHLTLYEYLLYGVFFIFFPLLNMIVACTLYAFWKDDRKTKAYQVMMLCLVIFVLQVLPACGLCCMPIFMGSARR